MKSGKIAKLPGKIALASASLQGILQAYWSISRNIFGKGTGFHKIFCYQEIWNTSQLIHLINLVKPS
jgi:hypothetical protein